MTKPRDPEALLSAYLADGMEVLSDRVVDAVLDEVHRTRQRAVFGPWTTRSMFTRRRSLLIAAALLVALAVASAVAVGALRLLERDPIQDLTLERPADLYALVVSTYDRLPELPPVALTWHDSDSAKGRIYVDRSGAVRFDRFTSAEATEPSSYTILSPNHRVSGMATVGSDKVWVEPGHEAIGEDPRVFIQTILSIGEGPDCDVDDGTGSSGWRYVGAEYIAGRPTHHIACVSDLWIDAETSLLLRIREPLLDDADQPIPGQYGITEVTEMAFGEQPAALFEAPDGMAHMTSQAYSAYLCTRDVQTEVEVGLGTRECESAEQPEAPAAAPSPTPTARPTPIDCAAPTGPSEPTGPLTWTQASLKEDWPAPVRTEPAGAALVLPWPATIEGGQHQYTDPSGDPGSDCFPWVDIREVRFPGSWNLVSNQPPMVQPTEQWIAYGAVFDVDNDGVPDWRYGMDNMPLDAKGERPHRVWVTDLHSGHTESAAGPPYGGVIGDSFYPAGGDFGVRISLWGPGRPGHLPKSVEELATDVHFYAWASVIQDGRVVATDYAPDAGWLDPSILGVGRNEASPFGGINTVCVVPPQPGCRETDRDLSIGVTFTVPDGWTWNTSDHIDDRGKHVDARDGLIKKATGRSGPQGMSLQFLRGGWLFSDPCRTKEARPDIKVGPTANDFANALADHPLLDVTTPVPVTLGGAKGKYLDLQVPSNIADCTAGYLPWAPIYHAPDPNHRWHIWSLDVDGVRVVVLSEDFAGTSPADLAEMRAVIESIRIEN
jgi:hypothetical protein